MRFSGVAIVLAGLENGEIWLFTTHFRKRMARLPRCLQVQSFKYEQKLYHIFQATTKDSSNTTFITGRQPHRDTSWPLQFTVHTTGIPYSEEEPL